MRKRWKIALGALCVLVAVPVGRVTWLLFGPAPKTLIVEPGPTGRRVADDGVFGNYFPAPGLGKHPAVLVLGGSEGGLFTDSKKEALALQKAGYNALQLGYHNVPGQPSRIQNVPLETFFRGLDWLKSRPETDPSKIGLLGYSKGGEAVLLVATRYPGIKAVVDGMPSSVAWNALSPRGIFLGGVSSWSVSNKPIASLPYGKGSSKDVLQGFRNALATSGEHPDAVIPAERYGGKLLLLCGGKDKLWPSCQMADQIVARVRRAGLPAPTVLTYPLAGHGVLGAPLPETDPDMRAFSSMGGTLHDNAAARADSWPKVLAFLDEALKR
jgi:dienelactone hydrolase